MRSTDEPPIIEITRLLRQFQKIERAVTMGERMENDAEHSFQLALIVWWLHQQIAPELDLTKLLLYALAHDLVEVYAGDVDSLAGDAARLREKSALEAKATDQLAEALPDFEQLHSTTAGYKQKSDPESRFVYVVDKALPMINEYISKSNYYKQRGIDAKAHRAWIKNNIAKAEPGHHTAEELLLEIEAFLEEHDLFAKTK